MQACAAEGQLRAEHLVLGDLHDQAREDQVLLDLDLLGPRALDAHSFK